MSPTMSAHRQSSRQRISQTDLRGVDVKAAAAPAGDATRRAWTSMSTGREWERPVLGGSPGRLGNRATRIEGGPIMQRPEQHVIDTRGQSLLIAAFAPTGWVLRAINPDYGADYEVEVFENRKTTGTTFKIQLKSSEEPGYSADRDFLSVSLSVPRARYLVNELQVPTLLVQADVAAGRLYWTAPQLEPGLRERLAQADDDSSVTIRIPVANDLSGSFDLLVTALARARAVLVAWAVTNTPSTDFVAAVSRLTSLDGAIAAFREVTDGLRLAGAYMAMEEGELDRAHADLLRLWADEDASLSTRVCAVLTLERIETRQAIRDRFPDRARIAKIRLAADRLRTLVSRGPVGLKLYSLGLRKLSSLHLAMHEYFGVGLHVEASAKRGDVWLLPMLEYRRMVVIEHVHRRVNECIGFLTYALQTSDGLSLGDIVQRLGKALWLLANQLGIGGSEGAQASHRLNEQAFQLFRLAANLARLTEDEQRFADAVCAVRLLDGDKNSDTFKWMQQEFNTIRDPQVRSAAENYLARLDGEAERTPHTQIETSAKQILENLAAGLGIDVTDEHDARAKWARMAIDDLDPTRVLEHCEHTFVTLQRNPDVPPEITFPTAGLKVIHCTKHGHTVRGRTLDAAGALFRERFCASCPDVAPRAQDWIHTLDWQDAENAKHQVLAQAFWKKHSGLPFVP